MKVKRSWKLLPAIFAAAAAFGSGCNVANDTSGFKPEPKMTQSQLDERIAAIKADPRMSNGMKQVAIQAILSHGGKLGQTQTQAH